VSGVAIRQTTAGLIAVAGDGAPVGAAREHGWPAVSLSVEDGNGVVRLYRAVGFRTVGRVGGSDTMLLDLRG
jgi:hypothetical protein